ncbi:MAG: sulfatase-like hydrolase/transferase [Muribaculaceae bacterium]|nr:sulfatase-like hydrolase/transferase [Muribaculaceae bacterium]MCM1398928.1 sulfatase-like hydrolase/transferase [Clostridium sp.]MCM1458786.1 sulfatase-like hydrolase/transferase [Bacteroides sp.]
MNYDSLINKIEILMEQKKWTEALEYSREAVKRNRLNLQATYMLAVCAENTQEWLDSYRFYSYLYYMQCNYGTEIIPESELSIKLDTVIDIAIKQLIHLPKEIQISIKNNLLDVNELDKDISRNYFAISENIENYLGIHRYFGKNYYIGRYNSWYPYYGAYNFIENGVILQSEIYEIIQQGSDIDVDEHLTSFPCILPVVTNTENKANVLSYKKSGNNTESFQADYAKAYEHYRLEKPIALHAKYPMIIGKPIPLHHKKGNKKLILNIFIDSFNYKCIKEDKLRILMPHTYNFFKNGVICTEFYAGSEFTYPSIASYWTGYRPTHHQMLNQNLHYSIPEDMPLLSEVFHDNGYFTSKIGGNDSICPQYGYIRGIDRTLYGYSEGVFHADECVNEVIEHMAAFSETDNFIWMDLQDLHYVSGYWPMPLSVQTHLPIDVNVIDNIGGSSLYQTPSPNRRIVYERQLGYLDYQLKRLYDYILDHYSEDEIIVSLISDHGNAFNVDEDNYFICEQRMNVPLMLRGGTLKPSVCNERIETIDYNHIMMHLAGIHDERMAINDGQLPKFLGGTKEKSYVFSSSLFPDRYYSAMILGKGYKFYIQSDTKVQNDCRVSLANAHLDLRDEKGTVLEDSQLLDACMKIVEEQLGDFKLN